MQSLSCITETEHLNMLYTGNTKFKRILYLDIVKLEFLEFRVFAEFVFTCF